VSITRDQPKVLALIRGRRARAARNRVRPRRRLATEVIARWHGAELDRRLAGGEGPWAGDALAVRARQLTTPRSRRQLARGLVGVLRSARGGAPAWTAATRPYLPDVADTTAVIAALSRRLRAPEPVSAQGVAMVRVLLTDGNGLLYQPGRPGELGGRLRAAAAALEPRGSVAVSP
jgi:hypothetical protein